MCIQIRIKGRVTSVKLVENNTISRSLVQGEGSIALELDSSILWMETTLSLSCVIEGQPIIALKPCHLHIGFS